MGELKLRLQELDKNLPGPGPREGVILVEEEGDYLILKVSWKDYTGRLMRVRIGAPLDAVRCLGTEELYNEIVNAITKLRIDPYG